MGFDAGWLDLRGPADAAARDPALLAAALDWLSGVTGPVVLDLGAGTGATASALAAPGVRWLLADNDPSLLAIAASRTPGAGTLVADLADLGHLRFSGVRLVTASALLDLAGASWLDALAGRLGSSGTALYAALSYDGALEWEPAHRDDAMIASAFNRHQRTEKGLGGTALGPSAARYLAAALARRGFRVRLARSPWRLGPGPLLDALMDGIADAAEEAATSAAAWRQARAATTGASVGHLDLFALPTGTSAQSKITSVSSP